MNEEFRKASELVIELPQIPSNEELLKLYALYKQATEGDVNIEKPNAFDSRANEKYRAWAQLAGKPKQEAEVEYISLVNELKTN